MPALADDIMSQQPLFLRPQSQEEEGVILTMKEDQMVRGKQPGYHRQVTPPSASRPQVTPRPPLPHSIHDLRTLAICRPVHTVQEGIWYKSPSEPPPPSSIKAHNPHQQQHIFPHGRPLDTCSCGICKQKKHVTVSQKN